MLHNKIPPKLIAWSNYFCILSYSHLAPYTEELQLQILTIPFLFGSVFTPLLSFQIKEIGFPTWCICFEIWIMRMWPFESRSRNPDINSNAKGWSLLHLGFLSVCSFQELGLGQCLWKPTSRQKEKMVDIKCFLAIFFVHTCEALSRILRKRILCKG